MYSTVILLLTVFGNTSLVMKASFSSGGTILALVSLGKALEGRAKDKTVSGIKALSRLAPDTVCVLRGDEEVRIPEAELTLTDTVIVKAGGAVSQGGTLTCLGTTVATAGTLQYGIALEAATASGDLIEAIVGLPAVTAIS